LRRAPRACPLPGRQGPPAGRRRARAAGLDPALILDLGFALYAEARLPGLWEEIEQAWWEYESAGRPDADQFGLTVTDRGQQVWLRDPSEAIRPSRA
jgi:hypothetical protein